MKALTLKIEFFSYWQVGSGKGRGADVDAVVLKGADGLPFIPGKELKGLFREAVLTLEENGHITTGSTDRLFGKEAKKDDDASSRPGLLRFTNARLEEPDRSWLASEEGGKYAAGLFGSIASTRLDRNGIAQDKTLRTIEVTIPVTLGFQIESLSDDPWDDTIVKAAKLVRALGMGRHRGLGRCEIRK